MFVRIQRIGTIKMFTSFKKFFLKNADTKQTIIKNTFWLTAGELFSRFLRFFVVIYAARVLGASGWGVFSYALSLTGLIMIFSDLGLSGYVTREWAKNNNDYSKLASTAFVLKILILISSVILVVIMAPSVNQVPEAARLLMWVALILFFDSLRDLGFAFVRAFNKMELQMFTITITNLIILVLGLFLLHKNPAPISVALAYLIGSFIGCIIIFLIIRKKIAQLVQSFHSRLIGPILMITFAFSFTSLFGHILGNIDIYMLGLWKPPAEIGFYAAGQRFYQFILAIPAIFSTAVFPMFSKYNESSEKFGSILQKSINIILTAGIPIAIGGIILAHNIVIPILGTSYAPTIPVFQVLMAAILVSFPLMMLSGAAFAKNKQKIFVKASIIGGIINIVLNFFLIPHFGALGTAIATLISLCVAMLIANINMRKVINFSLFRGIGKPLVAGGIMGLICLVLETFDLYFVFTVLAGGIVYATSLILLKAPLIAELKNFISSFNKS